MISGNSVVIFNGSFTLSLFVEGTDGREYDIYVHVLWDSKRWLVDTEVGVANDAGGQDMLRALPVRSATVLSSCLEEIKAAVVDFAALQEVVRLA